jgi:nucleotidyltransferase substrate binding protein (TIGR01987 family)
MNNNANNLIRDVKRIILKHANPERIYLYGSYANGLADQGSDIDIAYEDKEFKDHYLIADEIEKLRTLVKIDVQNIAHSEKRFNERVKATGKVIYSASKKLRAEDGLHNFSNAFERFSSVLDRESELKEAGFDDIYLDLVIKRFEFTFEMSWKALKRYLSFLGIEAKSPRVVFQEAYAQEIITNEAIWLDMIEQRNLSSQIYDEFEIKGILDRKGAYHKAFLALSNYLKNALS